MKQHYENYTAEDLLVWKKLFERQKANLADKCCAEYMDCLEQLSPVLNANKIPEFTELSESLTQANGWSIVVVPGIVPVDEFFCYLSKRQFCSSTWLRKMSQLDYLEEPDMFHDIFGHTPLLMNKEYANYMEQIGKLGVAYKDNAKVVSCLQNLYWFTIEFGLLLRNGRHQTYGAGIISSFGETNHIFTDQVKISPFDLNEIINKSFVTSEIQNKYFELKSFEQLYETQFILAELWEALPPAA